MNISAASKFVFFTGFSLWVSVIAYMLFAPGPNMQPLRVMALVAIGAVICLAFIGGVDALVKRHMRQEEERIRRHFNESWR